MVLAFLLSIATIGAPGVLAQAEQPQAMSLLGEPLAPRPPGGKEGQRRQDALAAAWAAHNAHPDDLEATIALAGRMTDLDRYIQAIELLTRAIESHPDEARLYETRARDLIAIRRFDPAIRDGEKIVQLAQTASRSPSAETSCTLGLAHYLKGEFAEAHDPFARCLHDATTPDLRVTAANWLYMTLRRLQRRDEAQRLLQSVSGAPDAEQATAARDLLRLYAGQEQPSALLGGKDDEGLVAAYGVANWYLYNARGEDARALLKRIVRKHEDAWDQPAYIAAEADYARIVKSAATKTKKKKKKG